MLYLCDDCWVAGMANCPYTHNDPSLHRQYRAMSFKSFCTKHNCTVEEGKAHFYELLEPLTTEQKERAEGWKRDHQESLSALRLNTDVEWRRLRFLQWLYMLSRLEGDDAADADFTTVA